LPRASPIRGSNVVPSSETISVVGWQDLYLRPLERAYGHRLFDRLPHGDDPRDIVIVPATDYWKWIGTLVNYPDGNGKVQNLEVVRGPHPQDGDEILALVVWDGQQRRPIFSEPTGSMVSEDN
jgi:hypothetical protein